MQGRHANDSRRRRGKHHRLKIRCSKMLQPPTPMSLLRTTLKRRLKWTVISLGVVEPLGLVSTPVPVEVVPAPETPLLVPLLEALDDGVEISPGVRDR